MTSLQRCERCGTRHPGDSTAGLCPACLVRLVTGETGAGSPAPEPGARLPGLGSQVGDYVLEGSVGAGGMGVVFRARHQRLKRIVALKMLPFGRFSPDAHQTRFRAEAEAVAGLRHPNIVTLYEIGEHEGQPFLAMEFVDGPDLGSVLQTRTMPVHEAAGLVARIARAIHHAHQKGIAHRDLKPSNILLDSEGQPRVTDFGLAKNLFQTGDLTVAGQPFGSPNYIPPEQASGQRDANVVACDVYGLGAILYHLLTRRPPFVGETVTAVLHQLVASDPPEPRLLNPAVPRDLQTICLHCLEKDPPRRYRSAAELAEELERFLRDEPIAARPIGAATRAWRWCRRRPALAAMTAATTLAVCAGLLTSLVLWRRAQAHAQQADENLLRVELERVEDLFERGESPESMARLARLMRAHPDNPIVAQRIVSALTHRNFLVPASPEFENAHDGRLSPLALARNRMVTAARDAAKLIVWQLTPDPERETEIPLPAPARLAAFSGDGTRLAIALRNRTVQFWDLRSGPKLAGAATLSQLPGALQFDAAGTRLLVTFVTKGSAVIDARSGATLMANADAHFVEMSPNGQWLVTVTNAVATLWDTHTWAATGRTFRHAYRIETARFSPDSSRVVTASADMSVRIWDVTTGRPIGRRLTHPEHVMDAVFSPDGQRLLTQLMSAQALLWDAVAGMPLSAKFPQWRQLHPQLFSPNGLWLVSHFKERIWLRDAFTGTMVAEPIVTGSTTAVRFLDDERRIVTTSFGGRAQLWSVQPGDAAPLILPHQFELISASFSPDGAKVLTVGKDASAQIWATATGEAIGARLAHERRLTCGTFNAAGTLVATGDAAGLVRIWKTDTGQPVAELPGHAAEISGLAFSPDGQRLCSTTIDGVIRGWNMADHSRRFETRHPGRIRALAVSPGGKHAATAGEDAVARLWTLSNGERIAEFSHDTGIAALAFSPDGQTLAAGDQGRIRFWSIASKTEAGAALQHASTVLSVRYSRDGTLLASASADHTARVWHVASRRALTPPLVHRAEVSVASFSPDGRHVLTASDDHTARIWHVATGLPVSDALPHGNRAIGGEWAPDGRIVVTASWDGAGRIWSMPLLHAPQSTAPWLANVAELYGGLRLAANEVPDRVERARLDALKPAPTPGERPAEFDRWADWLTADRSKRPISPAASIPAAEHARARLNDTRPDRLRESLRFLPNDATGLARWSRLVLQQLTDRNPRKVSEATFAAERAVAHDPTHHEAWWSLAQARLAAGDQVQARTAFQRLQETRPADLPADQQRALAELQARLEKAGPKN